MKLWHVGVAEQKREGLVEWTLKSSGVDVYVPRQWRQERLARGGQAWATTLLIPPYFYAEFDGVDLDEYARIKMVRGVLYFLESSEHTPGIVPGEVIEVGRQQELLDRAGCPERFKSGRPDLVIGQRYMIAKDLLWRGKIGKLINLHNGRAQLDVGKMLLEVDDAVLGLPTEEKVGAV